MRRRALLVLGAAVAAALTRPAAAQHAPAATYPERYEALAALADQPARAVAIRQQLVLTRDAARFTLEDGTLYLLGPLAGRGVAAAFVGHGRFEVDVPPGMEQDRVQRMLGARHYTTPIREAVLVFTDSTLAELERGRTFAPAGVPGPLKRRWRATLDYLSEDRDHRAIDPDVMRDLLNGTASGVFYAEFDRDGGDPAMFMLDPYQAEGVRLLIPAKRLGFVRLAETVAQFRRRGDTAADTLDSRHEASVRRYAIETWLPRNASGEVSFSAAARMEITADEPMGPWLPFSLYYKLEVDSARWADGAAAVVHKSRESPTVWVRLPEPLAAGAARSLTIWYHGDLIDRYGDFFYMKSSIAWYPRSVADRSAARFELTFHTPTSFQFASVGERTDSSVAGSVLTTRWVVDRPTGNASFNLGFFEGRTLRGDSVPPVTLMMSERGHRALSDGLASQWRAGGGPRPGNLLKAWATEHVAEDVVNSLKFFRHVYGEPLAPHFYVTEIPWYHGEAFPGMIDLSWVTFFDTGRDGNDEVFRAHEIAHQWWGLGVQWASYRDRWLSEGFADFSGLWYMQTARKDNARYFAMLDRWRADIGHHREAGPIAMGHRIGTLDDGSAYNVVVYRKGAWVLHMLRMLMLDLKTMNEDRFASTMRDFYTTYRGRRASTQDFRRVAERHLGGMDLGWFFEQWVDGTAIPTYRVASKTEPAEGGKFRLTLRVDQLDVPESFQAYVPVSVDLGQNRWMRLRVKVSGPRTEVALPLLPAAPRGVKFNDFGGVLAEVKTVGWGNGGS